MYIYIYIDVYCYYYRQGSGTRVEATADEEACGRGEDGRDCCGRCERAVRQDPAVGACYFRREHYFRWTALPRVLLETDSPAIAAEDASVPFDRSQL